MITKIAIASRNSPKIADDTRTAISNSCNGSVNDSTNSLSTSTQCGRRRASRTSPRRAAASSAVSPLARLPTEARTDSGAVAYGCAVIRSPPVG